MIPCTPNSDYTAIGLQPDSRERRGRMEAALRFALADLEEYEASGRINDVCLEATLRALKAALKGS